MTPIFDWSYALEILPTLGAALVVTIQATVLGMLVAVTLGLALALLRRSRLRLVSWPAAFVIEFVRSTPLLVQMYFLFYVLPLTGFAHVAAGHRSAGAGPALRRLLRRGVPRRHRSRAQGQTEAAIALNLPRWHTAVDVVLPQAIPPVVPALGNYLVAMFKDTPLLSAITVVELLQQSKMLGSATFRYTEPLTLVGALFLALSLLAAWGVRGLETRLQRHGGKR